MLKKWFCFE